MPAQFGGYDTLRSLAGKAFTYLASITLTGTDGKTITVTQDTSLDEAVAMSSKAPKASPTFTTQITTPIIALTGGQIAFPAVQAASADANTLDDYEENTWVPTVTPGAGAITAYTTTCAYVKIGKIVICYGKINISNNGTGSGSVIITLPFTSGNTGAGCGRERAATGNQLQLDVASGETVATIYTYDNLYPGGTNYELAFQLTYSI
jgi:hypothetical protein